MVIYRPHKSTLQEAMKESKEFNNFEEMKKYILNLGLSYIKN